MSSKHKRKSGSSGEHWTKMLRATMQTEAWQALSCAAQSLYPWLKMEWRGPTANNNGKIRMSVRQAADRLGVNRNTAAEAFRDLQRKGFIVQTEAACLGIGGAAKSPSYEITELKMPGAEGDGRKLYRDWRTGHDYDIAWSAANNPDGRNGRKIKPCHKNHDGPVLKIKTETPNPVLKTKTGRLKNDDEKAVFSDPTVLKTKTSLSYHRG